MRATLAADSTTASRRGCGVIVLAALLIAHTFAQAPLFEVASIKRHNSSTAGQTIGQQGDRFVARNVTVRDLIATAYRVDTGRAFTFRANV